MVPFLKITYFLLLCKISHPMVALIFSIVLINYKEFWKQNSNPILVQFPFHLLDHIILLPTTKLLFISCYDHHIYSWIQTPFYGVPNSAHITKDLLTASIYGTPHALQQWKQEEEGTLLVTISILLHRNFSGSLHANWRKQLGNKLFYLLQCGNNVPYPFVSFSSVPLSTIILVDIHILHDCQSEIIFCKKADVDDLVKFVLDSIQV